MTLSFAVVLKTGGKCLQANCEAITMVSVRTMGVLQDFEMPSLMVRALMYGKEGVELSGRWRFRLFVYVCCWLVLKVFACEKET